MHPRPSIARLRDCAIARFTGRSNREIAKSRNREIAIGGLLFILIVAGCRRAAPEREAPDLNLVNKVAARAVTLYFESPEMVLAPETRTVEVPENEAAALSAVLRELLKGSTNVGVPNVFPPDSVVRATYLLPDGTAVIDLGGPSLTDGWNTGSHTEMMAVYSMVQTLMANFPTVRRVRFVVNGQPAETLAGHIRIDRPLRPLSYLVRR
jgi:spore germination protein GerM